MLAKSRAAPFYRMRIPHVAGPAIYIRLTIFAKTEKKDPPPPTTFFFAGGCLDDRIWDLLNPPYLLFKSTEFFLNISESCKISQLPKF